MKQPRDADNQYIRDTPASHRRKLGQFFTPDPVAAVMQQWVNGISPETVLDPAAGTGRLLAGFPPETALTGFDVDKGVLQQAAANLQSQKSLELLSADYLLAEWESRYQGIICNPPYIKFKSYPNKPEYFQLFEEKMGFTLSGYSNLYVLFLLKGLHQLDEKGRAAFIVPSEFLNAAYGEPVRALLASKGNLVAAAVTDFTFSWFDQAATTSTLLFIDNNHLGKETAFYLLKSEQELAAIGAALTGKTALRPEQTVPAADLAAAAKWQVFYQSGQNFNSYALKPLNAFANVNRGIATGANSYFCFNEQKRLTWDLGKKNFLPCLSRASQIKTSFFDSTDWQKLYAGGEPVLLLNAADVKETDSPLSDYLVHGELTKMNQRYLTNRRQPWYKQETRKAAPILAKVFFREKPLFIRNHSNAVNLTPFHCIYLLPEYEQDTDILMAFLLTSLAQQIFSGQHKQYGRGLKKFEPGDLKAAPVADLDILTSADKQKITELYRNVKAAYLETGMLDTSELDVFFEKVLKQAPCSQ